MQFKPDLIRSFAVGFALGCMALFATMGGGDHGNGVVPAAIAAQSH
jgi:hypothetical protein